MPRNALQAPTGSNRQGWQWMFITDESDRATLKEIYAENFALYRQMPRPEYDADDPRAAATPRVVDSAQYLADNFEKAPVLLIPCIEGKTDADNSAAFWGSLLPAVWSFMLALRERGLGSAWTTLHMINGGEKKAAELLGIPSTATPKQDCSPLHTRSGPTSRSHRDSPLLKSHTGVSGASG